jgi:hypothetical protein
VRKSKRGHTYIQVKTRGWQDDYSAPRAFFLGSDPGDPTKLLRLIDDEATPVVTDPALVLKLT